METKGTDGPLLTTSGDPYERGRMDMVQDGCENAPFASIGGLDARTEPKRPHYITESEWPDYRRGYEEQAAKEYGLDWRTCSFGWAPALTIPGKV